MACWIAYFKRKNNIKKKKLVKDRKIVQSIASTFESIKYI